MTILLATVRVPFIYGGAEVLSDNLQALLRARGHLVDTVALPFKWYPSDTLLETMVTARMMDLSEVNGQKVDLLLGLKFPAYYAPHTCKVIWLLHQHRQAYDLWRTPFGDIHHWPDGAWVQKTIQQADTAYLGEARARYTISQNVTKRLSRYNGLDSTPLYHPPFGHELLGCRDWEPFIFYPSRITEMKRQGMLVEAARHLKGSAQIVLAGTGSPSELEALHNRIRECDVASRVRLLGFITEEAKRDLLSRCAAVFFGGYDEDYGYVTLEAMFSGKPVLALSDSGGALEFVREGYNGYIVEPDARALAEKVDAVTCNLALAQQLGRNSARTMIEERVDWDHVITTLLSHADA